MTNILNLPQLGGGVTGNGAALPAAFAVTVNADWRDVIQFTWAPGTALAGQPIDLTGIRFFAQLRPAEDLDSILLDMSTDNNLMVNGGDLGTLAMAVPCGEPGTNISFVMADLPVGTVPVMDLIAVADNIILNLNQVAGPAQVSVGRGVTTSATLT